MSGDAIGVVDLKMGILAAGRHVSAVREELCRLDAVAGDGDLGVTLAVGVEHVEQALLDAGELDVGKLLKTVGLQLSRHAPSTIGVLLGSAFLRVGRDLDGVAELDGNRAAAVLEGAAEGVAERGGAKPGERTVLDAMSQAAADARSAADRGLGARDVLREGAAGAEAGAVATANMEPVHGRAGWIAERARGQQDAGASAWASYLRGLVEGLGPTDGVVLDGNRNITIKESRR